MINSDSFGSKGSLIKSDSETLSVKNKHSSLYSVDSRSTHGLLSPHLTQRKKKLEERTVSTVHGQSVFSKQPHVANHTIIFPKGLVNSANRCHLEIVGARSLHWLLETSWIKDHLKEDGTAKEPLTEEEVKQLSEAALKMNDAIDSGAPGHVLAWHANALLGRKVSTVSFDHMKNLTEKTIASFVDEAKMKKPPCDLVINKGQELLTVIKDLEHEKKETVRVIELSKALDAFQKVYDSSTQSKDVQLSEHEKTKSQSDVKMLAGLRGYIDEQIEQLACEEFKQILNTELAEFGRGGSKKNITVKLQLGVAVAYLLGVSVSAAYSFDVASIDSTCIVDKSTLTGGIDFVFGRGEVVRLDLGGQASTSSGKLFDSVEAFVNYHANDILPILLSSFKKKASMTKSVIRVRRSDRLHRENQIKKMELESKLIARGIMAPGDRLELTTVRRSTPTYFSEGNVGGYVQVSALEGLLTGKCSLSNTRTEFRRYVPLQDSLNENPELLKAEDPMHISFNVGNTTLSGSKGMQWIEKNKKDINELIECNKKESTTERDGMHMAMELEGKRRVFREAMASLYIEYDHYASIVNKRDGNSGTKSTQDHLGVIKHDFEKSHNVRGRAQYMRSIITTQTHLMHLYKSTFVPGLFPPGRVDQEAASMFNKIEAEYSMPQMHLDDRQAKKHLFISTHNNASQKVFSAELKVAIPHIDCTLSTALRKEHITGHYNSDCNGDYMNISFSAEAGLKGSDFSTVLHNTIGKSIKASDSGTVFLDSLPTDMQFSLGKGGHIECHLIKGEKGYCIQYVRVSQSKNIGGDTPEIPLIAGPWGEATGKVGIAYSGKVNAHEYVGNNTLTYFFTCYNGWAHGKKASANIDQMRQMGQSIIPSQDAWDKFLCGNQKQVKKLLRNLANHETNAAQELMVILERIENPGLSKRLHDNLAKYDAHPTEENYKTALADFNEMVASNHKLHQDQQRRSFVY